MILASRETHPPKHDINEANEYAGEKKDFNEFNEFGGASTKPTSPTSSPSHDLGQENQMSTISTSLTNLLPALSFLEIVASLMYVYFASFCFKQFFNQLFRPIHLHKHFDNHQNKFIEPFSHEVARENRLRNIVCLLTVAKMNLARLLLLTVSKYHAASAMHQSRLCT